MPNIEGVPEGYRLMRIACPQKYDRFIHPVTGKPATWMGESHGDRLHAIIEPELAKQQQVELRERERKLEKFFLAGMEASFEGCDWGGSDIQSTAVELGLARWEEYEPDDKHSDLDIYGYLEPGDSICVIVKSPDQASAEEKPE